MKRFQWHYILPENREPALVYLRDRSRSLDLGRLASCGHWPLCSVPLRTPLTPPRVIAFCDTDASLKFVDVAIPTNNKSKHAIGLMWYLLCREVLRLRGTVPRGPTGPSGWDVLPDLFFYRDPEEIEREAADKAAAAAATAEAEGEGAQAAEWSGEGAPEAAFAAQPTEQGECERG